MKKQFASLGKDILLPGPPRLARVFVCEDADCLSRSAADFILQSISSEPFHFVLSGGSTPRAVYELLARSKQDWNNVHFYWGDERCVPPDHPESNFRMTQEALLGKVTVQDSHIHRMRGELDPALAADEYERELRGIYPDQPLPRFDMVLLGLGDDGHTASLFPHTPAVNISDRWVVSNFVEKVRSTRLTLTFPVLNGSSKIVFMVSGKSKIEALNRVFYGPYDPMECPAQLVRPTSGELYFFVDRESFDLR